MTFLVKRPVRRREGLRRIFGAAAAAGAAVIGLGFERRLLTASRPDHGRDTSNMSMAANAASDPVSSGPLRVLLEPRQWLNTPPLSADDLRGKVVVVNFWTYSCINSLRTLPYLRAWSARYQDRGLVVIGVHTPEFAFERDVGNVSGAAAALDVPYPVVIDSDYAIWRAFGNDAWPGFYFIGADGRVRDRVLGEGNYDQSERLIQRLLSEADHAPEPGEIAPVSGSGAQAAPDFEHLRSPETYVGYAQATGFASPGGVDENAPRLYQTIVALPLNHWGLAGVWTVGREFGTLNDAPGSITYRFHARDLHLVLAPPAQGRAVRFRATIDGVPPGADHGVDVDAEGWGSVQDARLYQLVRQAGAIGDRTFAVEFFDAGVRAYVFTFG